ncbi:hypothetical protein BUALT_Bualt13G0125000 [Buddleja alternifolia]|uniref:Uncharacterized protein n=1 Tax=Buddleja alternifolia TaxID=168488 RepID=A0AAV6WVV8_9LAMI|nr:hypothetical protein BUALT_Bualt13G0125000 [Buddleja alternifolia]
MNFSVFLKFHLLAIGYRRDSKLLVESCKIFVMAIKGIDKDDLNQPTQNKSGPQIKGFEMQLNQIEDPNDNVKQKEGKNELVTRIKWDDTVLKKGPHKMMKGQDFNKTNGPDAISWLTNSDAADEVQKKEFHIQGTPTQLQSLAKQMHSYNKSKSVLGEGLAMPPEKGFFSTNPFPIAPDHTPSPHHLSPFPHVELPPFDGDNPRAWIRRTQRYFQRARTPLLGLNFYLLSLKEEEDVYCQDVSAPEDLIENLTSEDMTISTNAISGSSDLNTLRIQGLFKHSPVQILIDSGNTHCFLDEDVAIKLRCSVEYTNPMLISVADGKKIVSNTICPDFSWDIQGSKFTYPMRLIKLGGCDVVLGGDWLRLHSLVEFDYHKMRLTICKNGKELIIKAITNSAKLQIISANSMGKFFKKGSYGLLGQLFLFKSLIFPLPLLIPPFLPF